MKAYAIILICSYLFAAYYLLRRSIHMLQLSSYQAPSYFKTVLNLKWFFPHIVELLFALFFLLFTDNVSAILFSVMFAFVGIFSLPHKAKKPLVFTHRVQRLFITCAIINIAIILLLSKLFASNIRLAGLLLFASYALSAFVAELANLINYPLEKLLSNRYILDAKRKLKNSPNLSVIGVTGSYGKTSVKHYLHTLLSDKFEVLMTPQSYNTPLGIVRTIRENLCPTHEYFVCEMGARHVGDIKEICDIVHPKIGVITFIGEQHLETFKTLENIKNTKLELARAATGLVFMNGDSIKDAKQLFPNCITYGISPENDYNAENIRYSEDGMSFTVISAGEAVEFTTDLIGEHNAQNILGAIAVSHKLGVPLKDLVARVKKLKPVAHRLEIQRNKDYTVIDDSYNSNPQGAKMALEILSSFDGYKIIITPGMVELGEKQYELNFAFGKQIAATCDAVFLVGKSQTQSIYEGIVSAGYNMDNVYVVPSFQDAMSAAKAFITGDKKKVILIENDLPDNY